MRGDPKTLIVISGKGGTGKTSVAASLAFFCDNAVIADCDVDAPDLHILLGPEYIEKGRFMSGHVARIDGKKCTLCGRCANGCAFNAIESGYVVDEMKCEGCAVCNLVCPSGAIGMLPADCGEWYVSETRAGRMVHARLEPGKQNSGRLVSLVRSKASTVAKREGADLVIVDGPPGIGCPVIAAMSGCDIALLVTEPTLSGLSDLERVVGLADHFRVGCLVAINKCDLNEGIANRIEAFCEEREIAVVGRVKYDLSFTRAQLERKTLLEYGEGELCDSVKKLCAEVIRAIQFE